MTDKTIDKIFYIQRVRYFRDRDNYPDSEIVDDDCEDGFFTTPEAAYFRMNELNKPLDDEHEHNEKSRRKAHEADVRKAQRYNREAAAIRAAGMKKSDVKMPTDFKAETFQQYLNSKRYSYGGYDRYKISSMSRSPHDKKDS